MTKRRHRTQGPPVAEAAREETNGAVSSAPELTDATRDRIAELSRLEADWDSYGALRISPQAIAAAGAMTRGSSDAPLIDADGTIRLS